MPFLRGGELGFAAAEFASGLGDRDALAGAGTDEVDLEFSDHTEDVEKESADVVGGVVERSPRIRATLFIVSSSAVFVASRRYRARRSNFVTTRTSSARHAARAYRRPRPGSSRPQEPVVNMHVMIVNTEHCKPVRLCGETLSRGRDARVSGTEPPTPIAALASSLSLAAYVKLVFHRYYR